MTEEKEPEIAHAQSRVGIAARDRSWSWWREFGRPWIFGHRDYRGEVKRGDQLRLWSPLAILVRMRGLEPPRDCSHSVLSAARLPVPPHPQSDRGIVLCRLSKCQGALCPLRSSLRLAWSNKSV